MGAGGTPLGQRLISHGLVAADHVRVGRHRHDELAGGRLHLGEAGVQSIQAGKHGAEVDGLRVVPLCRGDRGGGDPTGVVEQDSERDLSVSRDLRRALAGLVAAGEVQLGERAVAQVAVLALEVVDLVPAAGAAGGAGVRCDVQVDAVLEVELLERDRLGPISAASVDEDRAAVLLELHVGTSDATDGLLNDGAPAQVLERAGGLLFAAVGRRVRRRALVRRRRAALGLGRTRESGIRPHDFGLGVAADGENGENGGNDGEVAKVAGEHFWCT